MTVGATTAGRMQILGGGVVINGNGVLGRDGSASGSVMVTGAGSTWNNTGLTVGSNGIGLLEIASGAVVNASVDGFVAANPSSSGDVYVTGGSKWILGGNLYIGGNTTGAGGPGAVHVSGNGQVTAAATLLYGNGGLILGTDPVLSFTSLTSNGGYVRLEADTTLPNNFNISAGGLRFETNGHTGVFAGNFTGSGGLTKAGGPLLGAGTLTLTGTNNYIGTTTVSNGILLVNGSVTSPVVVNTGATLGGTGAVGSVTVNSGGTVSPGSGALGTLTVNGSYNQTSNGNLEIQLGGTAPGSGFDRLAVSGAASIAGTLNLSLANGFNPSVGQTFAIISSSGASGNFSTINSSGFTVRSDVSATGVVLTVVSVEPQLIITSIAKQGGNVVVTFNAMGGTTYRLERKLTFNSPTWTPVSGVANLTPASNGSAQFVAPGDASLPMAFYRVVVVAPPVAARAQRLESPAVR